jgi:ketosteroid isomerase-like protein
MKLALAALVLAAALAPSPARAQASAADSVRALDAAWARSYATHDTTLAANLFADDIVVATSSGNLKTKVDEIGDVGPTEGLRMRYFRTVAVDVRVHPGAVVVTGVAEWEFTYDGRTSSVRRRYTSTWVRGGPLGWQMVALQLGTAPPAA